MGKIPVKDAKDAMRGVGCSQESKKYHLPKNPEFLYNKI